jgi:hypothetical protein
VGPRFDPLEFAASYPFPAAEGREWKYLSDANGWPMIREPISSPFLEMSWPLALSWNRI